MKTIKDVKFYTNESARKVVCVIPHTEALAYDYLQASTPFPAPIGFDINSKHLYKILEMPKCFVGIATCALEDEWNEEVGRLIAYSRAKHKMNKSLFKHFQEYVDYIEDNLTDTCIKINNLGEKIKRNTERRETKIKETLQSCAN